MDRKKSVTVLLLLNFVVACSSHPVLPTTQDVKVSRENPAKKCRELGPVEGRVSSSKGTQEEALEDLKTEAIRKGANFVKIEMMGAQGQSIRGTAYVCD